MAMLYEWLNYGWPSGVYFWSHRCINGFFWLGVGDYGAVLITDLAVGAPFDGPSMSGAVYIFLGGNQVENPHSQVGYMCSTNSELRTQAFFI